MCFSKYITAWKYLTMYITTVPNIIYNFQNQAKNLFVSNIKFSNEGNIESFAVIVKHYLNVLSNMSSSCGEFTSENTQNEPPTLRSHSMTFTKKQTNKQKIPRE